MALNKTLKSIIIFILFVILIAIIFGFVYAFRTKPSGFKKIQGLKFTPHGSESSNLIHYNYRNPDSVKHYTDKIDKFLEPYLQNNSKQVHCAYDDPPRNGKFCNVDLDILQPCTAENYYGYTKLSPCVFLTLNKISNWYPEFYNDTNNLPAEMPEPIKMLMQELPDKKQANNVWVSCEGENNADKEFIGPVRYYPKIGFPGYFFPIRNVEGYLLPIVAVMFERLAPDIMVNIECTAWAHNISRNKTGKIAFARFSFLIEIN